MISVNKKWTLRDTHVHKIRTDGVYELKIRFFGKKNDWKGIASQKKNGRDVKAKIACKILNQFFDLGTAQSE